jgi:putative transposase
MPYRKVIFANERVYHILNRGVARTPIFLKTREYQRFLDLLDFYRYERPPLSFSHYFRLSSEEKSKFMKDLREKAKLVEIFAYCLMPNHFHLLIRQLQDNGILKVLSNLQDGFVRFFNLRNERKGPLFESVFKAIRIDTDEQLLHVSRYIHLNPSSSYLTTIQNLSAYPWSSFPEYLRERLPIIVNTEIVLGLAGGKKQYEKFVFDQAKYQRDLEKIKHLALENL